MECQDVRLNAYLDAELTPSQKKAIEKHLQACADCRHTLSDLSSANEWLHAYTDIAYPQYHASAPIKFFPRFHTWARYAVAASVIFAMLGGYYVATSTYSTDSTDTEVASEESLNLYAYLGGDYYEN